MANGIRTGDPRGFNKGHSSKFHVCSRVQQTPEEGWRTYRLKRCGNNNEDEDNVAFFSDIILLIISTFIFFLFFYLVLIFIQ